MQEYKKKAHRYSNFLHFVMKVAIVMSYLNNLHYVYYKL